MIPKQNYIQHCRMIVENDVIYVYFLDEFHHHSHTFLGVFYSKLNNKIHLNLNQLLVGIHLVQCSIILVYLIVYGI